MRINTIRVILSVMLIAVAALVLALATAGLPASAQGSAADMRALLEASRAGTITIQFASPIVGGETLLTLPDEALGRTLADVGADYLCLSEPWNNGFRSYCTPFSNVVSVSYIR